jgi:hypothetical protein
MGLSGEESRGRDTHFLNTLNKILDPISKKLNPPVPGLSPEQSMFLTLPGCCIMHAATLPYQKLIIYLNNKQLHVTQFLFIGLCLDFLYVLFLSQSLCDYFNLNMRVYIHQIFPSLVSLMPLLGC